MAIVNVNYYDYIYFTFVATLVCSRQGCKHDLLIKLICAKT
jgi:hypothetical protein